MPAMTDDATAAVDEQPEISPDWLNNLAALGWRLLAIAAFVVVALYMGQVLWAVTGSIAVAIVISAVFAPYVLRIRASGRSNAAAAGIVWLIALVVVGGLIALVALAFLPYAAELVAGISSGIDKLHDAFTQMNVHPIVATIVEALFRFVRGSFGDVVKG